MRFFIRAMKGVCRFLFKRKKDYEREELLASDDYESHAESAEKKEMPEILCFYCRRKIALYEEGEAS